MKQKAFIFGSGGTAKMIMSSVEQKYDVIGFLDNDPKLWTEVNGGGGGGETTLARK
ncbi:MAG: hypothetical protein LBP89_02510 [Helicobacteraceae bacterium]|jgi:FlaA1/EpsC-like NDP-sugar epimerase|nr:hypothetical protein [Helicobacteraceae bacterium]